MPPKSKAKAKQKQKQKQKQTQVVNIKIGDTSKPKPKRTYTRKPKAKATGGAIRADALPDGWLPPVNLTRSGQVFPPYVPAPPQTSYSSGPPPVVTLPPEILQRIMRLEQTGSAGRSFAPPPPPTQTLMEGEEEPFEFPEPPPETPKRRELPPPETETTPKSFIAPTTPAPEVFAPIDIPPLEAIGVGEDGEEEYVLSFPKKKTAEKKSPDKQSKEEVYEEIINLFNELDIGSQTQQGRDLVKSILGIDYNPKIKKNSKVTLIKLRNGLRDKLAMESNF